MFSLIHNQSLNPQAYERFSEDPEQRETELEKRKETVLNFIKNLGRQVGIDNAKTDPLQVAPCSLYYTRPYVGTWNAGGYDVMFLSPHCFFDLAEDFQIHNLEELEEKLQNNEWTENAIKLISEIKGTPITELTQELIEQYKTRLRTNIGYLMNDPEKSFNSERYLILSTFSHIQNETSKFRLEKNFCAYVFAMIAILISISLLFPIVNLIVADKVISALITLSVSIITSAIATLFFSTNYIFKKTYAAADQFASSAFTGEEGEKIRQGGLYYYESLFQSEVLARSEETCFSSLKRMFIDPYPSTEERIERLKHFELENAIDDEFVLARQ